MKTIGKRTFIKSLIMLASGLISRLGERESIQILKAITDNPDTFIPSNECIKIDVIGIGNAGNKALKMLGRMNLTGVNVSMINESIPHTFPTNIYHTDLVCIVADIDNMSVLKMASKLSRVVKDQGILSVGILIIHDIYDHKSLDIQRSKVFDSVILIPDYTVEAGVGLIVKTFSDFVNTANLISLDIEDLEVYLENSGIGHISTGIANGKDRVKLASHIAINNLRYHSFGLKSTDIFLINVAGPESMALHEVEQASDIFYKEASYDENLMFTVTIKPEFTDEIRVTVFGLGNC